MQQKKHEIALRQRAIEVLSYWEGRLVTNRLMEWFGISRQQASADIKKYLTEVNPGSLHHDPAVKGYIPKAGFQPVLTKGDISEYLDLVSGMDGESGDDLGNAQPHLVTVTLPDRTVRPEIVRELLKASRSGLSVKILYASMTNPIVSERVISPHTLVYTGFRWHVRAFCHKRREFRDFILSRIDRAPWPAPDTSPSPEDDSLWTETIQLTLVPNPKLNDKQKAVVEKDFGMPDGRLHIRTRKALAHYTLQRYQAAITVDEAADEFKFPIILLEADRKRMTPLMFGAEA